MASLGGSAFVELKADVGQLLRAIQQVNTQMSAMAANTAASVGKANAAMGRGSAAASQYSAASVRTAHATAAQIRIASFVVAAYNAAIILALKQTLGAFAEFEQKMANIRAVTSAGGADMALMAAKAQQMGRTTMFSASEAAEAMLELGKAGQSTTEIMQTIQPVLDLAAAGDLTLAESAVILTNAINTFGFAASDAAAIADKMAVAANISTISVRDLAESLKYVGASARNFGQEFDAILAGLALLGNLGIRGTRAGTSLAAMFEQLAQKRSKIEGLLDIQLVDPETDKFKQLPVILNDIREAGITATQVVQLFAARGGRALSLLILAGKDVRTLQKEFDRWGVSIVDDNNRLKEIPALFKEAMDAGASFADINTIIKGRLEQVIDAIEHASGTAREMANIRMNTLQNQTKLLANTFNTMKIAIGAVLAPQVTRLVTWVASLVAKWADWINANREAAKTWVVLGFAIVGIIGYLAAVVIGIKLALIAWAAFSTAVIANPVGLVLAAIGFAAAGVAVAFGLWKGSTTVVGQLRDQLERTNTAIANTGTAIQAASEKVANVNTLFNRWKALSKELGVATASTTDARPAFAELGRVVLQLSKDVPGMAGAFAKYKGDIPGLVTELESLRDAYINVQKAIAKASLVVAKAELTKLSVEYGTIGKQMVDLEEAMGRAEASRARNRAISQNSQAEFARSGSQVALDQMIKFDALAKRDSATLARWAIDLQNAKQKFGDLPATLERTTRSVDDQTKSIDGLDKNFIVVKTDADKLANSLDAGGDSAEDAASKFKRLESALESLVEHFMTDSEKARYELAQLSHTIDELVSEKFLTEAGGAHYLFLAQLEEAAKQAEIALKETKEEIDLGRKSWAEWMAEVRVKYQELQAAGFQDPLKVDAIRSGFEDAHKAFEKFTEDLMSDSDKLTKKFNDDIEQIIESGRTLLLLGDVTQTQIDAVIKARWDQYIADVEEASQKAIDSAEKITIDVAGEFESGISNILEAFRTGGDWKKAITDIGDNLVRAFEDAFAKILIEKVLHLDEPLILNIEDTTEKGAAALAGKGGKGGLFSSWAKELRTSSAGSGGCFRGGLERPPFRRRRPRPAKWPRNTSLPLGGRFLRKTCQEWTPCRARGALYGGLAALLTPRAPSLAKAP